MRKKVLLIGNTKSSYITQYVENVLSPLGFDVCIQEGCRHLFHYVCQQNKYGPFDYINLQFVDPPGLLRVLLAKKHKGTKLFASFWGSDLLRAPKRSLRFVGLLLDRIDYITADTYLMVDRYNQEFPKAKNKLDIVYFGVSLLPYIDRWIEKKDECRQFFGIPKNKTVIAIGYNSRWEQQHDKVIASLDSITDKSKYFIVLQCTYGNNSSEYNIRLKRIVENSGFEYKIITDFLSIDNLAMLRTIVDIFINAQTTDAFCNSIKEYMYAKTQIISASWLHYPEIDMFPLHINEFSNFDEIPALLEHPISEEKLEWNKKRIKEESSWEACRNKWAEAYGVNAADGN